MVIEGLSLELVPAGTSAATDAPSNAVQRIRVGADMAIMRTDGSVDRIDAGPLAATLSPTALTALLIECRRVLRAGGLLRCEAPEPLPIARIAALAGFELDAGATPRPLAFRKPDRQLAGDPLVSIAIPAYSPRFFAAALASALGQTYDEVEIVVCDDSGGDEIESIVRRAERERPLRYVRNRLRLGTRGNLARGLHEAKGEFVKYLNDDDLLVPDAVATLVDAFRRAPDIVLATSYRRRIDDRGAELPDQPATRPIAGEDIVVAGATLANAMLLAGLNIVGEPTSVLFRRRDFPDRGDDPFGFDGVPARGAVDMAMWATLLLRGNAVWHRKPLSDFRIHARQSQQDASKRGRAVEGIRSLQEAWIALGLPAYLRSTSVLAQPYPLEPEFGWQWHPVPALEQLARARRFASDGWRYAPPGAGKPM